MKHKNIEKLTDIETIKSIYIKKSKRLDRIVQQSDKQQLKLLHLNEMIEEQQEKLQKLYTYNINQQLVAKEKLESLIVNDFENKTEIAFKASDTLSGDYYSLHKLDDGSSFIYLIDGQGHGVAPALTIFATCSNIANVLQDFHDFETIVERLFSEIRKFLIDFEQLSFTFVHINSDQTELKYTVGGMYPFYIKTDDGISQYKANSLPFMDFSPIPTIKTVKLNNIQALVIYSDGLVEEDGDEFLEKYSPENILKSNESLDPLKQYLESKTFEDDVTIIKCSI